MSTETGSHRDIRADGVIEEGERIRREQKGMQRLGEMNRWLRATERRAAEMDRGAAAVERGAAAVERWGEVIQSQDNIANSRDWNDRGNLIGAVRTFTDQATGRLEVPTSGTVVFPPEGGMRWTTPAGSSYAALDISGVTSINGMDPGDFRRAILASQADIKKSAVSPQDPLAGLGNAAAQPLVVTSDDEEQKEEEEKKAEKTKRRRFTRKRQAAAAKEKEKEEKDEPARKRAKKKKEEEIDQQACVVCMENRRTVAFVPCGHVCCCPDCVRKLPLKPHLKCPECRARVERAQFLYL